MALKLNALLEITAKVFGKESVEGLSKSINGLEGVAKGAKEGLKGLVKSDAFKAAAVAATGLGVAIVDASKNAIALDTSLRDVSKVVESFQTPQGFEELKNQINEVARVLPLARDEIAGMYAAAAKAGIAAKDVQGFTIEIGKTAIAWDMAGQQAATSLAQIKTALNLDLDDLYKLRDAMNQLAQESGISAESLVQFMTRAGAVGKQAGFAGEETAAFGAAMISTGNSAKVAATSFRAMVSAFQSGDSMTARQIGALNKLGVAMEEYGFDEAKLTAEIQRQGKARVDAIKLEVDAKLRELDREYRERKKMLSRQWEDIDDAQSKGIRRRYEALQTDLDRRQRAEVKASNDRASATDSDNTREINAIEDKYKRLRYNLQDAQDKEMTMIRRQNEDRRQEVLDSLADEHQAKKDAIKQAAADQIALEKEITKQKLDEVKAQAKNFAMEYAKELQKEFAKDPVKVIEEFFAKIRDLPKELQGQVVSDFFGDQARAIVPLIENEELLAKNLRLVGDESNYMGSTMKEAAVILGSMNTKAMLAKRPLEELRNELGGEFAKAQILFLQAINPILEILNWFIQEVPGVKQVIAALAIAFVGLVAALPVAATILGIAASIKTLSGVGGIAGLKIVLGTILGPLKTFVLQLLGIATNGPAASSALAKVGQVAGTQPSIWTKLVGVVKGIPGVFIALKGKVLAAVAGLGAKLAGSKVFMGLVFKAGVMSGKVVAAFTGLGALIMKALGVVGAILSGPVGWAILAAGLITLIVVFREQIGDFFNWVGETFSGWIAGLWEWGEPFRQFWIDLWNSVKEPITGFFTWLGEGLYNWFVQPFIDLGILLSEWAVTFWNSSFMQPIISFFTWLGEGLYNFFIQPWIDAGTLILEWAQGLWNQFGEGITTFFGKVGEWLYALFVEPFVASFEFLTERWDNLWVLFSDIITNTWTFWSTLFYELFVAPFQEQINQITEWWSETWQNISTATSEFFQKIAEWFTTYLVEPIVNAISDIGQAFSDAWNAVGEATSSFFQKVGNWFNEKLVQPITNALGVVRDYFSEIWNSMSETAGEVWDSVANKAGEAFENVQNIWGSITDWFSKNISEPLAKAWQGFTDNVGSAMESLASTVQSIWESIRDPIVSVFDTVSKAFQDNLVTPIQNAWDGITKFFGNAAKAMMDQISGAFAAVAGAVTNAWSGFVSAVQAAIAAVVGVVNRIIRAVNSARGAVGMGALPTFAKGGYVTQATVAMVGEGGQPEYIIPADKMRQAALAYLGGVRGESVLSSNEGKRRSLDDYQSASTNTNAVQRQIGGGLRTTSTPASVGDLQVSVTTGPVTQLNGEDYVTKRDMLSAVRSASSQTRDLILKDLKQPSTRQRLGIN